MLTTLSPSRVDDQNSWEPQYPGVLSAHLGSYRDTFTFTNKLETLTVAGQLT